MSGELPTDGAPSRDGLIKHELIKDCLLEADSWKNIEGLQDTIDSALDMARLYVDEVEGIKFLPECEVSLVLMDDEGIRHLNAEHRDKDKATNVLSFPIDEDADIYGPMLGDIVFAYETIKREAEELGLAFNAHLTHLCIHGFLHLLGYDHIEPSEADKMEQVEVAILSRLHLANPYEGTIPLTMPD